MGRRGADVWAGSRNTRPGREGRRRGQATMKRFVLAAVLVLGLFALTGGRASASGFGNGGTYGISPGSISFGIGFNLAWSGVSFGQMNGGCAQAPCYGPP